MPNNALFSDTQESFGPTSHRLDWNLHACISEARTSLQDVFLLCLSTSDNKILFTVLKSRIEGESNFSAKSKALKREQPLSYTG